MEPQSRRQRPHFDLNYGPWPWGMVVFTVTGASKFQDTRIIPTQHLKDLSFGYVPTIFQELGPINTSSDFKGALKLLGVRSDNLDNLEICSFSHRHLFSSNTSQLLFPVMSIHSVHLVSFEIIAMLSVVFRLRGSNFKRIPNPTRDRWINKLFKSQIHETFHHQIERRF